MIEDCLRLFNTRFLNITKTVDLKPSMISTNKSIFEIIKTFKDHREKFSLRREECQFKFHFVSENEIRKVNLNIDGEKANLTGDISVGILKRCLYPYISVLTKILNTSLERGCFPNQLKFSEVTPVSRNKIS